MNETTFDRVWEFHRVFGVGYKNRRTPVESIHDVPRAHLLLQMRLIREEYGELVQAVERDKVEEIADAMADLDYVLNGLGTLLGIQIDPVAREVHRSNMTKLGEYGPIYREDGKVQKGPNFEPPAIKGVLAIMRYEGGTDETGFDPAEGM